MNKKKERKKGSMPRFELALLDSKCRVLTACDTITIAYILVFQIVSINWISSSMNIYLLIY
jgi:hypothetical protein